MFNKLDVGGGLTFLLKFEKLNEYFEIYYFSTNKFKIKINKSYRRLKIIDIFKSENIIVANSVITAFMSLFLPFSKKKFYVTHGYANAYNYLSYLKRFVFRLVLFLGKNKLSFIACGYDEQKSILKLQPKIKNIILIPNAIQDNNFLKYKTNSKTNKFLFIGRISYQKGLDLLLDAIMNLNFFVSLDIAGPFQTNEEKYINIIKTKVKYLNKIGHDVSFIGIVDLKKFSMSRYKCVFIPSRFEGFAFLPLELSMIGIPYIISNCLGLKELLKTDLEKKYSFENDNLNSFIQILMRINKTSIKVLNFDFKIIHSDRILRNNNNDLLQQFMAIFKK